MILFFLLFILAPRIQAQQSVGSIQQNAGDCAVNVAGVQGNVTIQNLYCPGVSPKALEGLKRDLNRELRKKEIQVADLKQQVEQWRGKYEGLLQRLAEAGIASEQSRAAAELVKNGDLKKAGELLEQAVATEEREADQLAFNHFILAQVFLLQRDPKKALEHLEIAFRYRPQNMTYANDYAVSLKNQGRLSEGEQVCLESLATAKTLEKTNPQRIAIPIILNTLGNIYMETRQLADAEKVFRDALQATEDTPQDQPDKQLDLRADILTNLGEACLGNRKLQDADRFLSGGLSAFRSLQIQHPGLYDSGVAAALINLGNLHLSLADYSTAETEYQQALDIQRSLGIFNGRGSPAAVGNLANVEMMTCNFRKAQELSDQVVGMISENAKVNAEASEPDLGRALENAGSAYLATGDTAHADARLTEGLRIYETLARKEPKAYLWRKVRAAEALASVKLEESKPGEAEFLLKEASADIAGLEKTGPPGTVDYLLAAANADLARVDLSRSQAEQAKAHYEEALEVLARATTPDVIDTADAQVGLADIYQATGESQKARDLYSKAELAYRVIASKSCDPAYAKKQSEVAAKLAKLKPETP